VVPSFLGSGTPFAEIVVVSEGSRNEHLPQSVGGIAMRAKHVVWYLLLVAMAVVSGCEKKRNLVGRWDMGRSNFYFREDGVVFYLSSSKVRYQGRFDYDDSKDPGIVRAELQAINSDRRHLSLELLVTFLSPDRIRFDSTSGGPNPSTVAARTEESPAN
jgi:hypothetical protein